MTNKITQKVFLKGTHEFEIVGEMVNVRIKGPFQKESISVMLAVLNPEPVINGNRLEFVSRVNGEELISMFRDKPDAKTFNAFVDNVKQLAQVEYRAFSGIRDGAAASEPPVGLAGNVSDAPPEFDSAEDAPRIRQQVRVKDLEESIQMLQTHLGPEVEPLIVAMEALKSDPDSVENLDKVATAFNDLGFQQGAVLTYAPYISFLLSDDPFSGF